MKLCTGQNVFSGKEGVPRPSWFDTRISSKSVFCDICRSALIAPGINSNFSKEEYRAAADEFDSAYALFKEEQEELERLEEIAEAFKTILQNESLLEKIGL